MKFFIITLVLTIFPAAVLASSPRDVCLVTVKITAVGPGEHKEKMLLDNGSEKVLTTKFTELTSEIMEISTYEKVAGSKLSCEKIKKGSIRKYGLCEDVDILPGHIIKANTGGWVDGPECFVDVEFIE